MNCYFAVRFQYLKKKSDEDISICVSQNGTPKYSKTIAVENQLSSIFKRDIENWLKPLLVFDSRKRGNYSEEKTDVFKELDVLLKKKIITIYSVFNYCTVDYEITETTRLSNIKSSIENDFCIPRNKQMFILDKQMIICDDNIKLMELFKDINQRTMFVFKKDSDFNARVVTIPQLVQALFQPINTQVVGVIKKLYTHAIFFINQEEKLLEQFQTALLLQIEHTNLLFKTVKKLHSNIRNKLIKLITQTECFSEFNEVQKPNFAEDEEYKNYLAESRRYLRQAKELIENFNSLTGRLLKILNTEWVSNYTESLRNALNSTDVDMKNMYKNATTLYQKLSPSNFYSIEMMKILSNVLQLPRTAIFSNDDLKKYIKSSLYAQRSLLKLLPWCKAIDGEVQKVSSLLLNSEKSKYEIVQRICSKPNKVTITVPNDCSNIEELNDLIKENLNLRYKIQEVSDEGSMYIRHLQKNMIYFWNDVISRKNPK